MNLEIEFDDPSGEAPIIIGGFEICANLRDLRIQSLFS